MAFIYKELTEKDKAFFQSFNFRDPLSFRSFETRRYLNADHTDLTD